MADERPGAGAARNFVRTFLWIGVLGTVALVIFTLIDYPDGIIPVLITTASAAGIVTASGSAGLWRSRAGRPAPPLLVIVAAVSATVAWYVLVGLVVPMPA